MRIRRGLEKLIAGFAGLMISAGIGIHDAKADNPVEYKIMTYNLHQFGNGTPATVARLPYLRFVLRETQPDIIRGEELMSKEAAEYFLREVLNHSDGPGGYAITTNNVNSTDHSIDSVIFYKPSRVEFVDAPGNNAEIPGVIFTDSSDHWVAAHFRVFVNGNYEDIYDYGAHLDSASNPTRAIETCALRKFLEQNHRSIDNIVVKGDFNMTRNWQSTGFSGYWPFVKPCISLGACNLSDMCGNANEDIILWDSVNPSGEDITWTLSCENCPSPPICNTSCNADSLPLIRRRIVDYSTRHNSGGSSGDRIGLKERYTMQIVSKGLHNCNGLELIGYEVTGNSGEQSCRAVNCPPTALRDALVLASDHLPVIIKVGNNILKGDVNYDGSVNAGDINGFIEAILKPDIYSESMCPVDMNSDGILDGKDVRMFSDSFPRP